MRSYFAFTKKEFIESIRTYKMFIMLTVFLFLGMINPITAKLTPKLLESLMPKGINITITEPTALDSWTQFFKNVPQMGLIVLIIIFSGMMANEISRGTLINMLTKGLPRKVVILSKFTMAAIIWTLSYLLCFIVTYAYTAYFWSQERIHHISLSVFCLWLFGILLLAIILFGGVLFKNSYGSLLLTGGVVICMMLINIIPKLQKYNPITLATGNMSLLTGNVVFSDFYTTIAISCLVTILILTITILLFNKKDTI